VSTTPASSAPLASIGRLLPLPVPDWSKPIILALLVLAVALAVRSRLQSRRARRLEAQRTQLADDLEAMQRALVPAVPQRLGGLSVSVAYRPAEGPATGGDFYDVFPIGTAGVGVVLGDASGHGPGALARSALMRYTLRAYVEAGLEPRAALALAGQVLADESAEKYTTVAVGVYDTAAGTLTYAAAGHPAPVLLGPTAHQPVTVCSSPAVGWGVPTGRRQTTVSLPAGSLACFFSDGLTEARANGRMLGRKGLEAMLRRLGPGAAAATLVEWVHAGADEAADDMAACIVGADPACSVSALRVEELLLDERQLRAGHAERFLNACTVAADDVGAAAAQARRMVAESGGAVLRVRAQPEPTEVVVTPRHPEWAGERSRGAAQALAPA
jgi:hypothetical protein